MVSRNIGKTCSNKSYFRFTLTSRNVAVKEVYAKHLLFGVSVFSIERSHSAVVYCVFTAAMCLVVLRLSQTFDVDNFSSAARMGYGVDPVKHY